MAEEKRSRKQIESGHANTPPSSASPGNIASGKLLGTEEQFRLLVDSVVDYAIFLLDTQGRIVTWNRGAQRIKGYNANEIIGRHFSTFYTPEDIARDHPSEVLAAALRDGHYEEEGWRVRKDGTRFLADIVLTALSIVPASTAGSPRSRGISLSARKRKLNGSTARLPRSSCTCLSRAWWTMRSSCLIRRA